MTLKSALTIYILLASYSTENISASPLETTALIEPTRTGSVILETALDGNDSIDDRRYQFGGPNWRPSNVVVEQLQTVGHGNFISIANQVIGSSLAVSQGSIFINHPPASATTQFPGTTTKNPVLPNVTYSFVATGSFGVFGVAALIGNLTLEDELEYYPTSAADAEGFLLEGTFPGYGDAKLAGNYYLEMGPTHATLNTSNLEDMFDQLLTMTGYFGDSNQYVTLQAIALADNSTFGQGGNDTLNMTLYFENLGVMHMFATFELNSTITARRLCRIIIEGSSTPAGSTTTQVSTTMSVPTSPTTGSTSTTETMTVPASSTTETTSTAADTSVSDTTTVPPSTTTGTMSSPTDTSVSDTTTTPPSTTTETTSTATDTSVSDTTTVPPSTTTETMSTPTDTSVSDTTTTPPSTTTETTSTPTDTSVSDTTTVPPSTTVETTSSPTGTFVSDTTTVPPSTTTETTSTPTDTSVSDTTTLPPSTTVETTSSSASTETTAPPATTTDSTSGTPSTPAGSTTSASGTYQLKQKPQRSQVQRRPQVQQILRHPSRKQRPHQALERN